VTVRGSTAPETIARVLDPALHDRPNAAAVIARSGTLSYAALDEAADRAAAALWQLGLRPGDRVAVSLANDLDVVVAFHGAMRMGAVWVGINQALTDPERDELLRHSAAKVLLIGPESAVAPAAPALDRTVVVGPGSEWTQLLAGNDPAPKVDLDPHAPAGIAYTSGTTGRPKGIVHSQHNLLLPGRVLVATRHYGPDLRKGDCLPLTILNLQVLSTLLTAQAQGCAIVMDRRDVDGVAEWIAAHEVNVWNGVPAQLYDLARSPDPRMASLREVWCGGSDCSAQLRSGFAAAYHLKLRATYGLTEAPTVVSIDPSDGEERPDASGQVLPHLDVAAYDDDGRRCPAGEVGELSVSAAPRGRWAGQWTPLLGEWDGAAPSAGPTPPIRTGDLGWVDGDGWLRVTDRRTLVVVRGGANVYPSEVERVLTGLEAVAAAAVFGVPDARLGERVAALVQPRAGHPLDVDELVAACRQCLARYKIPERWGVVEALPTNAMGKVVRAALPDLLASIDIVVPSNTSTVRRAQA
jgi:long-chain acyl-CoA synthetase